MQPKTKTGNQNQAHLNRLYELWPRLSRFQRKSLLLAAYRSLLPRLKSPVAFALRTSLAVFTLLAILPRHPMSLPTAAGGGLAFALLTH